MAKGQGWGAACFPPASSRALAAARTLEEPMGFSRARHRLKMPGVRTLGKGSDGRAVRRQSRWESLESKTLLAYR